MMMIIDDDKNVDDDVIIINGPGQDAVPVGVVEPEHPHQLLLLAALQQQ